jgi:hypothetical protein
VVVVVVVVVVYVWRRPIVHRSNTNEGKLNGESFNR